MSDVNVKNDGAKVTVGLDTDQDGKNSVEVFVDAGEGLSELLGKLKGGELKFNGSAKMDGDKVVLGLDLDNDGENSVEIRIAIMESIDEATGAIL